MPDSLAAKKYAFKKTNGSSVVKNVKVKKDPVKMLVRGMKGYKK